MNSIKFLGTAGARFVVMKQLRASGGIWLTLNDTRILIDPGPGALVKCSASRPKLEPSSLDAIILTHRHLDHSADINIMIEAMTQGGFKPKGYLFTPEDALGDDPVILKYLRGFVDKIEFLKEGNKYSVKNISFNTPKRHVHGVETYGLNVSSSNVKLSFITDTRYFEGLETYYNGDILILNVVVYENIFQSKIDHLNIRDAEKIISILKPGAAILTHFGMTMIKAKPWEVAARIQEKSGVTVIAARDGMEFNIDEYYK